ncbi:MAG: type IV pilus modification protein PilV, partial [Gammaproteobacteria bacterium]|nr:type IV pilus modification protein PilV [Gammaproteobacteria bacterium]
MLVAHNLKYNHQNGFTLLEVLISFVILSVGLLGIVSLQAMSKKFTHQAAQRTLAVSLADMIVEKIRTNPIEIATSYHNSAVGGGTITNEPSACSSACTTANIAARDLWEWEQALDATTSTSGLIDPHACINFVNDGTRINAGTLTVRVQWSGLNQLSDAAAGGVICNGGNAGTDQFRRQVTVNTYVIDDRE